MKICFFFSRKEFIFLPIWWQEVEVSLSKLEVADEVRGGIPKTQVHCLLTSGHWMHSLPHKFQPCFAGDDQPTDQLGNEVPTGQLYRCLLC